MNLHVFGHSAIRLHKPPFKKASFGPKKFHFAARRYLSFGFSHSPITVTVGADKFTSSQPFSHSAPDQVGNLEDSST
jgi:hypothetical protein